MMVHDFDDERTLDEEEALSGDSVENPDEELDDLQKASLINCLNSYHSSNAFCVWQVVLLL